MVSRRKFSDEYKRDAVQLATAPGVANRQVTRELGINANMRGWWCRDDSVNVGIAVDRRERLGGILKDYRRRAA